MFSFHEKRKLRQIVYSRLAIVVLLGLVVFLGMQVWDVFQKERSTHTNKKQQERELSELREREGVLRKEVERLETESGLESEIREKFEVGREGEGLIIVINPLEENAASSYTEGQGFWERVLSWFARD